MANQPPREKGGRVVFIGNIPYGVSEEQICDIFGRIGSVLNFRLVYDKETGKPKGFGFLEYPDVDQAAAAVRETHSPWMVHTPRKRSVSGLISSNRPSPPDRLMRVKRKEPSRTAHMTTMAARR